MKPDVVCNEMERHGQHRAFFSYDPVAKKVVASHPMFDEVAEYMFSNKRDYHEHEGVFLEIGANSKSLMAAFVHNTNRGPGAGGIRLWPYSSFKTYIIDGLRLSHAMGRKNSLAGLWWGGGKGVIARQHDAPYTHKDWRATLFQEYGQFLTSLRGCYYAAEDVGTTVEDIQQVFSKSRFTTCIPAEIGGSGNPSIPTAHGVVCAMEAALEEMGLGSLEGKRVAVQGIGNVGSHIIQLLLARGVSSVVASDVSHRTVERAQDMFKDKPVKIKLVGRNENSILAADVDIVSPCALGGVLNSTSIPHIKAKLVCGAANNQLLDDKQDDKLLRDHGITYVPDFLANRMGIVTCANEDAGYPLDDPAISRHFSRKWENSIYNLTRKVIKSARDSKATTTESAITLADDYMTQLHPIWPDRSRLIVQSLIDAKWHTKKGHQL